MELARKNARIIRIDELIFAARPDTDAHVRVGAGITRAVFEHVRNVIDGRFAMHCGKGRLHIVACVQRNAGNDAGTRKDIRSLLGQDGRHRAAGRETGDEDARTIDRIACTHFIDERKDRGRLARRAPLMFGQKPVPGAHAVAAARLLGIENVRAPALCEGIEVGPSREVIRRLPRTVQGHEQRRQAARIVQRIGNEDAMRHELRRKTRVFAESAQDIGVHAGTQTRRMARVQFPSHDVALEPLGFHADRFRKIREGAILRECASNQAPASARLQGGDEIGHEREADALTARALRNDHGQLRFLGARKNGMRRPQRKTRSVERNETEHIVRRADKARDMLRSEVVDHVKEAAKAVLVAGSLEDAAVEPGIAGVDGAHAHWWSIPLVPTTGKTVYKLHFTYRWNNLPPGAARFVLKVAEMDAVLAGRLQFAFTIMFHYLFPIGSMGLAPFIAWFAFRSMRGDGDAAQAARFWTKIFALNFAVGVVTGIPMEFQFGTNWALFSAKTGAIVGQPLAMEGIFAFFLESVFLGALLSGPERVGKRLYTLAAVAVWFGAWLSGYFVVVTDAWMQHPVGYGLGAKGSIELQSLAALLFSRFALWQYLHVMTGAVLTGAFLVAGVGAFYLLARRDEVLGRRFVRCGVLVGFAFAALAIFPTGDRNGADVSEYQPLKLAAMEGLFESTHGAPLAIIGMPDVRHEKLIDPIFVPDLLSFLAYGNFNAKVAGLTAYGVELWPPVELTYYAYHIMVGLGTIFPVLMLIALALLWRKRLYDARWLLWALMLAVPFPYIANEAGWTVTEVGRQPWIVYGLMKTAAAASPNVASGETLFTLIGFLGMYFVLGSMFLLLTLREIGKGPNWAKPIGDETSR